MYIYNIQATSSITKNFAVQKQAEKFANAIERTEIPDLKISHLHGSEEVKEFMTRRKQ